MKTLLALFFLVVSANPERDNPNPNETGVLYMNDNPYVLSLKIEPLKNDHYQIVASVELDSGSWFASPYSAQDYKGYFRVKLNNSDNLNMSDNFKESPKSVPKLDKWRNEMGNIVTENTSYSYELTVNSKEDFKVLGMVQFVIEPKCTFEEIPFSISSKAGKLSIQKYKKLDKSTCGTPVDSNKKEH